MASPTGAFFIPNNGPVVTVPGGGALPPTMPGVGYFEVFTNTAPPLGFTPPAGFSASFFHGNTVDLFAGPGSNFTFIPFLLNQLINNNYAGDPSVTVIGSSGDTVAGATSTVAGDSQLIDLSGLNAAAVAGPMTVSGGTVQTTVWAGQSDSIVGSSAPTFIDGHVGGADTIVGGAGSTTIYGAAGDSILGGSGSLLLNEAQGLSGHEQIVGGAGNLTVFDLGQGDTITGSTGGTTFVDDSYGSGGNSSITGGSGTTGTLPDGENTFIKAAPGDTIVGGTDLTFINAISGNVSVVGGSGTVTGTIASVAGVNTVIEGGVGDTITSGAATTLIDGTRGSETITGGSGVTTVWGGPSDSISGGTGTLEAQIAPNSGSVTVSLSTGVAGVRDVTAAGGTGANVTVTGFSNNAGNAIQSATSVNASNVFLGTSSSSGGNTTLTFLDGSKMTLIGVSSVSAIKFTQ
jgi:hypothetical protein